MSEKPDKEFGNVTCESLTIKHDNGASIEMSFAPDGRPFIVYQNRTKKVLF